MNRIKINGDGGEKLENKVITVAPASFSASQTLGPLTLLNVNLYINQNIKYGKKGHYLFVTTNISVNSFPPRGFPLMSKIIWH